MIVGALFTGILVLLAPELVRNLVTRAFPGEPEKVLAACTSSWKIPSEHLALTDATSAPLTIDYPQDGSTFPAEITPPTFIWRDSNAGAKTWRINILFSDGGKPLQAVSKGEPMQIGEIDSRCISPTNQLPSLTPEQAAAHTWKPDAETWALIKRRSSVRRAAVTITGLDDAVVFACVSHQLEASRHSSAREPRRHARLTHVR